MNKQNTSTIRQYGLKLNVVEDPRAYRLGAIELPKAILRLDGQWDAFLPSEELQITPNFETAGCTIYGTENIQQTLEKFHFGKTQEYSERYNYNLVKIVPPGADPHDAAESFRSDGVVPYDLLPITSTLEEYASPRPMPTKYISQGIAHPQELRHQWLWNRPIDKETRTSLIREYLQYSPLAISVTAWKLENGVYVDNGQSNTHWVMLYGWNNKGWLIFDSYFPHRKVLSFDHKIQVCKRYILVPSTRKEQLSIFSKILQLLGQLTGLIEIPTTTPKPFPVPVLTQLAPIPSPVLPPKYLWDSKASARHSVRVIADEEGLTVADKNTLCATVACESNFDTQAKNENKKDGRVVSTDWGICQINDHYHIGIGKSFPSVDYVLKNPEACIRWMCKLWKQGKKHWWICY